MFFYLLFVVQEYIRGLCDPELQKEERYPVDMHCIFAGARGLFLDRLIRDTSAEVLVPEPGRLRLLGRAEPVVMAQSRVQQFVALFQVTCDLTHFYYKAFSVTCICNILLTLKIINQKHDVCAFVFVSRRNEVYPATESPQ